MSHIFIKTLKLKKRMVFFLGVATLLLAVSIKTYSSYEHNKYIATLSWSVADKVIVIDPGHGGIDPGAVGKNGGVEKDITLSVSKRLANLFGQAGAAVILTRETDMDLSDPNGGSLISRKRQDLSRRVALANERNADLFLSIHVNSFISDPGQHGAQTFSQPGAKESKMISEAIQAEIINSLKNTKRKAKEVDYYTTRKSKVPAVLVEIGFITNPKEEKLMMDAAYQSKLAWCIYSGVVKYYANKENGSGSLNEKETIKTFMNNSGKGNIIP
ncbi:N-acetylmuramoyl-L-alanine amidase [Desulfolucanica intricata]|uniref:N-acetylmuramoyl-L-alanine amidase n=1 Tax=Desulfolucanica intricata TaxID=1285191 RepID=UPI00082CE7F6|nr:N-acetylmuramoyl-L-alanine amidase [Desulfolucanica intricata]